MTDQQKKRLGQLQAAIMRAVKFGDVAAADEARREFYTERLTQSIHDVLAKSPPLRPEQVERLMTHLAVAAAGVPS